jgi:iron complex outermembrane receptor protein
MKHGLLTALAALAAHCVEAQSIDYKALEQLFGENVTTSVTGSPQRVSDVPASVEIIDADEIRRSGAHDLPSLLRHVMSVDVLQTSRDHADVAVRGYDQAFSPRLLVLVDGRQVYADYFGFTPWNTVPVELASIRQIEIVRGPQSALFGFNAVGGVVNIITFGPTDEVPDSATAAAGTQGLAEASVVSGWKFGDAAGIRVSAGRRTNDDFSTPQLPFDVGTRRGNARTAADIRAGIGLKSGLRADFEAAYSDSQYLEIGPVYTAGWTRYQTNSFKGSLAADTAIGLVSGTAYRTDFDADIYPGAQTEPFLTFDNELTLMQLQVLSKIGSRHTIRTSLEQRKSWMETTPVAGAKIQYDVFSIGAMWEWRPTTGLALTGAVRDDRLGLEREGSIPPGYPLANSDWDRRLAETSFNAGVVWDVGASDTLRFLTGRGAELPSLFNLGGFLYSIPPAGYVTGVPTLPATIVRSSEVAWDHSFSALAARLHVGAFRGKTAHAVAAVGGADFATGILGMPLDIGDSISHGMEVSISSTRAEGYRWSVSYAPLTIDDRFVPGYSVATTLIDFEHTTPRHVVSSRLGWSNDTWEVDGYLRYESAFQGVTLEATNAAVGVLQPISSYVSIDARVGYRLTDRLRLAVSGQGLTRSTQRQTAGSLVERRMFATVELKL